MQIDQKSTTTQNFLDESNTKKKKSSGTTRTSVNKIWNETYVTIERKKNNVARAVFQQNEKKYKQEQSLRDYKIENFFRSSLCL